MFHACRRRPGDVNILASCCVACMSSLSTLFSVSEFMSAAITLAPSETKRRVVARPKPDAAPTAASGLLCEGSSGVDAAWNDTCNNGNLSGQAARASLNFVESFTLGHLCAVGWIFGPRIR